MSVSFSAPQLQAPPSHREVKKQRVRTDVHATALRLTEERGVGNLTVEQICDAALISPRTFFNYFPSKAAAIISPAAPNSAATALQPLHLEEQASVVPALCAAVSTVLPPDVARVRQLARSNAALRPHIHAWFGALEEALRLGAERHVPPQTAEVAAALVSCAAKVMVLHRSAAAPEDWDAGLSELLQQLQAVRRS